MIDPSLEAPHLVNETEKKLPVLRQLASDFAEHAEGEVFDVFRHDSPSAG